MTPPLLSITFGTWHSTWRHLLFVHWYRWPSSCLFVVWLSLFVTDCCLTLTYVHFVPILHYDALTMDGISRRCSFWPLFTRWWFADIYIRLTVVWFVTLLRAFDVVVATVPFVDLFDCYVCRRLCLFTFGICYIPALFYGCLRLRHPQVPLTFVVADDIVCDTIPHFIHLPSVLVYGTILLLSMFFWFVRYLAVTLCWVQLISLTLWFISYDTLFCIVGWFDVIHWPLDSYICYFRYSFVVWHYLFHSFVLCSLGWHSVVYLFTFIFNLSDDLMDIASLTVDTVYFVVVWVVTYLLVTLFYTADILPSWLVLIYRSAFNCCARHLRCFRCIRCLFDPFHRYDHWSVVFVGTCHIHSVTLFIVYSYLVVTFDELIIVCGDTHDYDLNLGTLHLFVGLTDVVFLIDRACWLVVRVVLSLCGTGTVWIGTVTLPSTVRLLYSFSTLHFRDDGRLLRYCLPWIRGRRCDTYVYIPLAFGIDADCCSDTSLLLRRMRWLLHDDAVFD